jgi:hypothetical protein
MASPTVEDTTTWQWCSLLTFNAANICARSRLVLWYYTDMAKRKNVEATEAIPVAPTTSVAEPKKSTRKSPTKPTSATGNAAHKHHAKKTAEVTIDTPVEAPHATAVSVTREQIAKLAYSYWEARGRQDGLAEQDWLRAERELSKLA